jgi:AraC-like DNA-binding protein
MPGLGPIRFVTRSRHHLRRIDPGTRSFRHGTHIIALHQVEGGHAGLGDEYVAVDGAFLALLPAGDQDINDMHGHDDAWWCAFEGEAVSSATGGARLAFAGVEQVQPRLQRISATQARRAETLFHDLRSALAADGLDGRLTALARLADLLALWLASGAGEVDDAVTRFHALIEESACDPACSLEALAGRLGRHADTLGAAFRRRYGCTPVACRTRIRLQRAQSLLSTGGSSLAEIAASCGFPDPGYFCRVFRRHVGDTPGGWARRFGGGTD